MTCVTDLSVLLNKLNEGFIALAAQLQVVHEAVKVFASLEIISIYLPSNIPVIIMDFILFLLIYTPSQKIHSDFLLRQAAMLLRS